MEQKNPKVIGDAHTWAIIDPSSNHNFDSRGSDAKHLIASLTF